mmetsp:Transcript_71042/g.169535  ORF Transcript_71042/g.169535 Transcript_71042/m.169535 type:complete len:231 (-) Transcript_71042:689-1381(-)
MQVLDPGLDPGLLLLHLRDHLLQLLQASLFLHGHEPKHRLRRAGHDLLLLFHGCFELGFQSLVLLLCLALLLGSRLLPLGLGVLSLGCPRCLPLLVVRDEARRRGLLLRQRGFGNFCLALHLQQCSGMLLLLREQGIVLMQLAGVLLLFDHHGAVMLAEIVRHRILSLLQQVLGEALLLHLGPSAGRGIHHGHSDLRPGCSLVLRLDDHAVDQLLLAFFVLRSRIGDEPA